MDSDRPSGEATAPADLPGKPVPYWIDSTPPTAFPALEGDVAVDVAVLGGGIAGITTAYLLKQAGATVAVLEAHRVVERVTGHTTAKITSLHDLIYDHLISQFGQERAQLYADAQQSAIERIASLVEARNIACDFRRTASYTYTESEQDLDAIRAEVAAATRLGLPASFVERTPLPYAVKGAITFANQAEFHPRKYLLALVETLPGGGSHVFEGTRALDIEDGEPCRVTTRRGTVTAKDVVIATHFPYHDPALYFAALFPKRSYVLGCRLHGPAPQGMFIGMEPGHHTIRSTPAAGGEVVLIGGEDHKTGQGGDTRERYRRLEAWARERFDVRSVDYRWATQDNETPDRVPYIGKLSALSRRLYVATGFGGWGMTNSMVAATLLSDMILGRDNPWAAVFAPSRFTPRSSARPLVAENVNVARQFVGGRFSAQEAESVHALRPGEGTVANLGGDRVAVSRDAQGALHAVSAVCVHMGCIVAWNGAEQSWDCPCHGSRYDARGRVIHGPANEDLREVDLAAERATP